MPMKFPWMFRCRRRLECGGAAALALAGAVAACGPEFPNSYYAMPEAELLAAPEGFFAAEIARLEIAPPAMRAMRLPPDGVRATTIEIDVTDVRRELEERGVAPSRAQQIAWNYEAARQLVEKIATARERAENGKPDGIAEAAMDAMRTMDELLAGVPAEFAHYLRGAAAWQAGDLASARREWTAVLALPADDRRRRSTWAAFMMGRAWLKEAGTTGWPASVSVRAAASRAFQQTRQFALAGLADPLGLATSSLGWEGRAALDDGDYPTAVALYLEQHAAGDPTALDSLRITAARMMAQPAGEIARFASDAPSRRVLTAYLVSRAGGIRGNEGAARQVMERAGEWAAALEKAGVREAREADRMAWVAYEAGQFALAAQWVRLAPRASTEANWIRAKLALRAGELASGEKFLRAALDSGSAAETHRVRIAAELSRVCLARDDYGAALAACLAGGHWADAAFVAEHVMTTAELVNFVELRPPVERGPATRWADDPWPRDLERSLRELLARRLAREGCLFYFILALVNTGHPVCL